MDDRLDSLRYLYRSINKKEDINMIKINDLHNCKNYIPGFDVMYIAGGELWFGKYDSEFTIDCLYMHIREANGSVATLSRTEALCFYDKDRNRWISQIDDRTYLAFIGFAVDTLKIMASFAMDELTFGKLEFSSSRTITIGIKNRFRLWFEDYLSRGKLRPQEIKYICIEPINKKEDINMNDETKYLLGTPARYRGIAVGDEVIVCDDHVNTKGVVTFIYVEPSSETASNIRYHVVFNNGMVGQYQGYQILRTGRKGHLGSRYYDDSNEAVKLYFDNKPVHINTNVKVDMRPHPKFIQVNNKKGTIYTTVVWKDGTHTIVKKAADDKFKIDDAIIYAVIKKLCGDNGCEMRRYFDEFLINMKEYKIKLSNEDTDKESTND